MNTIEKEVSILIVGCVTMSEPLKDKDMYRDEELK